MNYRCTGCKAFLSPRKIPKDQELLPLLKVLQKAAPCPHCGSLVEETTDVPPKVKHVCHATGCEVEVPPRIFMCRRHWYLVPKPMRDAIWNSYVPGQEVKKNPTRAYLDAASAAIRAVEKKEGIS